MPIIELDPQAADNAETRFAAAQSRPFNPSGDPTAQTVSTQTLNPRSDPADSARTLVRAHFNRSAILGAVSGRIGAAFDTMGSIDQGRLNPGFNPYNILSDQFIERHPYMAQEFDDGSVLDIPNEDAFWRYVRYKGADATDRETMGKHGFGMNLAAGLLAQGPEMLLTAGVAEPFAAANLVNATRSGMAARLAASAGEAAAINFAQEETIRALAPTKRNVDEKEAALMALGMGSAFGTAMPLMFKGAGSVLKSGAGLADRHLLAKFQKDTAAAMAGAKHEAVLSAAAEADAQAAKFAGDAAAPKALTILRTETNAAHLAQLEARGVQILEHPRQGDYNTAAQLKTLDDHFADAGMMGPGGPEELMAAQAAKEAGARIDAKVAEVGKTVNADLPQAAASKPSGWAAKLASLVTPGGRLREAPSAMARKVSNLLFDNSWATAESADAPLTHQVAPTAESLKLNHDAKFNEAQMAMRESQKAGVKAGGFTHELAGGETLAVKSTGDTRNFGRAVIDHLWREDAHARGQGEAPQSAPAVAQAARAARNYLNHMGTEGKALDLIGQLDNYVPRRWKAWEIVRGREDFIGKLIEQQKTNYLRDFNTGAWKDGHTRLVDEGVWNGPARSHLTSEDVAAIRDRQTKGEQMLAEATATRKQATETVQGAKAMRNEAKAARDQAAQQMAEARRFRTESESMRTSGNKAEATRLWKQWESLRDQANLAKQEAGNTLAQARTKITEAVATRKKAAQIAKDAAAFPKDIQESELAGILGAHGMGRYDAEIKAFWRSRAESTFNTLTNDGEKMGAHELTHGSKPMNERTLEIDPAAFRQYLHDDAEGLLHGYHHSTAGHLASRRAFRLDGRMQESVRAITGIDPKAENFDPALMVRAVNEHFQTLIDWARKNGDNAAMDRLENAKKSATNDILAKLNELHGANMTEKPIGWSLLGQRVSLRLPVMAYLGNLVASNISDIAAVSLASKMTANQKWQVVKALNLFKEVPKAGLESLFVGTMDAANHLRAARGMDIHDMPMGREYGAGTQGRVMEGIDKATEKGTAMFLGLTGMPRFNGNLRRAMGHVVLEQLTDGARKMAKAEVLRKGGMAEAEAVAKAGLSPEDATQLNRLGINGKSSTRIMEQLRQSGTDFEGKALGDAVATHDGFIHPQFANWSDPDAAKSFMAAVNRHTTDLILEPKLLSKPLMNRSWHGKVFNQMANFFYAWGNQQAVLAAQRPLTSQAQYAMMAVGLGAVADALHNGISGRRSLDDTAKKWQDDPVAMTYGAIDRSALLGWLARPIAMADKYNLGPNRFIKNDQMSGTFRQAEGPWEILGGPFASWAKSLASGTIGAAGQGKFGPNQQKQLWNATPYHNLWFLNMGLRAMEAAGFDMPEFTQHTK